jgi:SsrA-binding protein
MVYPFSGISPGNGKKIMSEDIKVLAKNKKARFLYYVDESMECGIALQGTEVKSMRNAMFSFTDSYAKIEKDELLLVSFHISPYTFGNLFNHDPDRQRKLLVHKSEIKKLKRKVDQKGFTLIPLKFYLKKGIIKMELGICKGKDLKDKRNTIKDRDQKIDSAREIRDRY